MWYETSVLGQDRSETKKSALVFQVSYFVEKFGLVMLVVIIIIIIIMRPSSLGGGRILRRTLSVCLSVCLSVRPVIG